ncbi:hypothetical protein SEA_ZUKO_40 [Streptomyces phage Zuko]|uniref:Uncharacterized protein n=1 Tax=Streptomyces phage Zuko TaxID=2601695 RepID=A0A5J6D6W7_9CAUD|nr:hypothetical protein PP630_gp040 [Streptomyces phage Zuko]QEQ93618.1 hypothetical protein SEA_ZUKO_40 [Streptomyces phage Zuko]
MSEETNPSDPFRNGGLGTGVTVERDPERIKSLGMGIAGIQPHMVAAGNGAVAATFSMEALKNALLGDETLEELVAAKRCSKNVGCGKSLVKDDGSPVYVFDTKEEAETYEMEFRRTGMCPSCLNQALSALDEGDEEEDAEPECNGICVSASDLGLPASGIAYPHPDCPEHGDPGDENHTTG